MAIDHDGLVEYLRRRLGDGVWAVELTPDQIDDAIDDTIRLYSRRMPDIGMDALDLVDGQNKYDLTLLGKETGIGVFRVDFVMPHLNPAIMFYPDLLNLSLLRHSQFQNYDMFMRWRKSFLRVVSMEPKWKYDQRYNVMWVYNPVHNYKAGYFYFRKRDLNSVAFNHEDWFYKYALAKARYQLGEIRSKYGNVVPASGGQEQLNGTELKTSAEAEIEKLEEQILGMQHPIPPLWD